MVEGVAAKGPRGAIRLTFGYEGSQVRLLEREYVTMLAPPNRPDAIGEGASGFWVELRSEDGECLYQHAMTQPVRFEIEAFPEDHSQMPVHVPKADVRGAFTVVIPDLPDARSVVLVSSPPEPGRASEPAVEIVEIRLDDQYEQGGGGTR